MKTACPCCGNKIEQKLPLVDLNTNTISFGEHVVPLQPQIAEFTHAVVERFPGVASYDYIAASLWGIKEPGNAADVIKVQACKVRRVFRKIGFDMQTFHGRGFKLEKAA